MFHNLFYEPVYNLLVLVLNYTPLHDIGTAIVIVTFVVKLFLLPLNISALRTQYLMKRIEPEMKKIRDLQKKDPQAASKKMIDLYRKDKINPFAPLFVIMVQIPVFIALYFVFSKGLFNDPDSIYSFVVFPETLHTVAFGIFDVTHKNVVVALLTGISSYFLALRQTDTMISPKKESHEETFQDHFMKSMRIQLIYVLPVVVTISSAVLPSALALYWLVNNLITYGLDVYMKRKLAHLKI